MRSPRLLDLFCCAGGAARGYADAGFEIVGVDAAPQKNYPFAFIQADVLGLDLRFLRFFDVIHASPPCQFGTALRHAPGTKKDHLNLIPGTRALLRAAGRPYVIENVEQVRSHLLDPVLLCGTMFGLGAQGCELHRHRLFESSARLTPPCTCAHSGGPVIGVYGGHARKRSARHGGRGTADTWSGGHKAAVPAAMGLPPGSSTLAEMSEAIPPAFTRHLGAQMRRLIEDERRAA